MRKFVGIVSVLLLSGCGSSATLVQSDAKIADELNDKHTHCDAIPRVYAGVAYDFCMLNSEVDRKHASPGDIEFYLMDMAFSLVADTVLLPYTITQQVEKGSIPVQ